MICSSLNPELQLTCQNSAGKVRLCVCFSWPGTPTKKEACPSEPKTGKLESTTSSQASEFLLVSLCCFS